MFFLADFLISFIFISFAIRFTPLCIFYVPPYPSFICVTSSSFHSTFSLLTSSSLSPFTPTRPLPPLTFSFCCFTSNRLPRPFALRSLRYLLIITFYLFYYPFPTMLLLLASSPCKHNYLSAMPLFLESLLTPHCFNITLSRFSPSSLPLYRCVAPLTRLPYSPLSLLPTMASVLSIIPICRSFLCRPPLLSYLHPSVLSTVAIDF